MLFRGETDAGFLGGGGFGVYFRVPPFSSSSPLPPSSSPFLLSARVFLPLCVFACLQDSARTRKVGAASACLCVLLSALLSLLGPASLSLVLSFFFSLYLSLSLMHALNNNEWQQLLTYQLPMLGDWPTVALLDDGV